MDALTLLRRLAEQHDYLALQESCLSIDVDDPAVQVLLSLACIRLGDLSAGQRILHSLVLDELTFAAQVDLTAVYVALGDLDKAVALLETTHRLRNDQHPSTVAVLLARLAWCRLQQHRKEDALELYEQSIALQPLLAVYINLFKLYRDSGRLAQMQTCLEASKRFWAAERADWPANKRKFQNQQLRAMQLDLWLALDQIETAEVWLEQQCDSLGEDDWSALLCAWSEHLGARDCHAQAEEWLRVGLRRYPENLALHRRLAELARRQGRFAQALALLQRAIALAQASNVDTHKLCLQLSATALPINSGLARAAAEQARDELVSLTNKNADTFLPVELALAEVEASEQDHGAAEQRYQRLLEQQPQLIDALQGLGQLYMQLGRIDEAVALFERIKILDPSRGHSALINARRFPDDDATLQLLEQLARTPGLQGSVRTGLLFQLAAAWEERTNYAKAFTLADEANRASRRLLRYDPAAHRQRCARIRHAFPKALFEHRADSGLQASLPVYVVGMPRSGTTLVEQILAGHSQIHGAGELGTIPQLIARLERWERHTGSARCYPDCVDDLDPAVLMGIAEHTLQELREYAPQADHVVDKLPHNFENIGLIKLLFPHARIISVRRDPRDIAVSNYFTDYVAKHGGMGFAYDLHWIGEQLADHNLMMRHWQQLFPGDILEISYEALLDDPQAGARRMLDHIGVDWEPRVLEFHALQRPVKTASLWQVRQPIYASSKGRWQHYEQHLKPLIAATNRAIEWEPIEMTTLPEPGWLNRGVDNYRQDDFDTAEYHFKRLLQHLPQHAAAQFMLGLVYLRKGHCKDAIPLLEQAVQSCPWNSPWRATLARAYHQDGRDTEATALTEKADGAIAEPSTAIDYLFTSEEATCSQSVTG